LIRQERNIMRLEVSIPDTLVNGVQRAAAASGLSLEAYMVDALQLRLQDDPEDDMAWFFNPQRIAQIREAQAEARTGNNTNLYQYRAEAPQRRVEWQANHRA
jgi:hypothetical protein